MQNNDFHCFEWLCIVFVWFAWFWLICIVFYDLHGFHTCSWYFNYFLFFYWEIMQILCATLTIVFFLSTITPTLKFHIWVQTWPGLTCGDLRRPAGTCGDRSRPAGIGAHFEQNLIWIFTFVPTPTSILVSCAFASKVWNHHSHNKKKQIFAWMSWTQHFSTLLATFFEQSLSNTSKQWIAMTNTSVSSTHNTNYKMTTSYVFF